MYGLESATPAVARLAAVCCSGVSYRFRRHGCQSRCAMSVLCFKRTGVRNKLRPIPSTCCCRKKHISNILELLGYINIGYRQYWGGDSNLGGGGLYGVSVLLHPYE